MTEQHFPDEAPPSVDAEGDVTSGAADDRESPETGTSAAGPQPDGGQADGEQPAEDPLAVAQATVAALTDDLKRIQAEYLNYKRRVDRDRELVLQNAKFTILSALLPVLDDLDRAREHGELEGGFKAVADSLERIVASQGLIKYGAPGDEFDPRLHEALMHSHSPDVTTTTCQHIVNAGYKIGDRVVRPAKVTVVDPEPGSEPAAAPAESAEQSAAGSDTSADASGASSDQG